MTAFRRIADAIHRLAPASATMWAPNYGGGYPFSGGAYEAKPGTQDANSWTPTPTAWLTAAMTPTRPTTQGTTLWTGWASRCTTGETPTPGERTSSPSPASSSSSSPEPTTGWGAMTHRAGLLWRIRAEPGQARGHPRDGRVLQHRQASARSADQAGRGTRSSARNCTPSPQLKMINWFEWNKTEPEVASRVDWTVTRRPEIREAFTRALPEWLHFANVKRMRHALTLSEGRHAKSELSCAVFRGDR